MIRGLLFENMQPYDLTVYLCFCVQLIGQEQQGEIVRLELVTIPVCVARFYLQGPLNAAAPSPLGLSGGVIYEKRTKEHAHTPGRASLGVQGWCKNSPG